jgi:hypothetical protein
MGVSSSHLQKISYREVEKVEKGKRKAGFIPENFFDFDLAVYSFHIFVNENC